MRIIKHTMPMVASCPTWLVWAMFGVVLGLALLNVYMGWVIGEQMQEIRALSQSRFLG